VAPDRSSDAEVPAGRGAGLPATFFSELAAAFRRHRPQGSASWNFSDAFTRLEQRFGSSRPAPPALPPPAPALAAPAPPRPPAPPEAVDRRVPARLRLWIAAQVAAAVSRATDRAVAEGMDRYEEGLSATVDAFRFLAARVEAIEGAATRRRQPVDGAPWLVPPPALEPWAGPISKWLQACRPGGVILHAECGDGSLAAALAADGLRVRGVEPRGGVAWVAAERGIDVEVGPADDIVGSLPSGSLAGLVLSGVVDRLSVEDVLALLSTATDRLGDGAPLVVVGTRPEMTRAEWGPVAWDLLPGRPWHPETWEVVLARAGYEDVGRLDDPPGAGAVAYGVKGRRPS